MGCTVMYLGDYTSFRRNVSPSSKKPASGNLVKVISSIIPAKSMARALEQNLGKYVVVLRNVDS
jgi:hypothetical protein